MQTKYRFIAVLCYYKFQIYDNEELLLNEFIFLPVMVTK